MDGLNRVYDRVLSGYIVTDIFIHNDFPDTYFGKELDQATYKRLKEDETFLVQTLKEIVGTFMRNGKISDTFWVHDKIFIGDEGICLLGEILTICQIVAYIDSDDLDVSQIEPNEVFKRALVKDFKGKMEEKRRLENFRRRVTARLEFCRNDDITGIINVCNENCYTGNVVNRQGWRESRNNIVYNSSTAYGNNKHNSTMYTNTGSNNDNTNTITNTNIDNNSNINTNVLGNYASVSENRQEKEKLTAAKVAREYKESTSLSDNNLQKHNLHHRDTNFTDQSQEEIEFVEDKLKAEGSDIRVNLKEDSNFKYICVLLVTGGRQQVRVLRFNRYCGNSIKLLTTLKGTITFLNDLRCLFKDFRAQVVLKDKLRREFFAYLNFRKTEPNFRGSKIVFEFFKSLHSRAIQPLFVGLNEHYLSLLEEAISYCPIVTYAFYKNIYLLKNIDINAPRRTWKVVCNLQKLYRHMKRVKEQMTEDGEGTSGSHDEKVLKKAKDEDFMSNGKNAKNTNESGDMNKTSDINNRPLKDVITSVGPATPYTFDEEEEEEKKEEDDEEDEDDDDDGQGKKKGKRKWKKKEKTKKKIKNECGKVNENESENERILKVTDENISHRENYIEETRTNMVKLFKTYGGQCRIGKVHGRCEDATFQTDFPPAFGIFDGVGSWSLEGIDASKFSIGLALACQREAEKLAKNLDGYAQLSHNTIIRSKLLLKNSHLSVKNDYTEAYGSSTAIVGIIDEYTGKCGIASLGDSVCMILRREFLPENINFERESYPKFPGESFLYFNEKGRNPSIIRKIIWKTTDQKWENGAPYQLSNLPGRSEWKDLERRGFHSFVKILEKVDIDGDSPDMAISPASEILCMPGDLILLMSDGVSDNLFDEEIEAYCTFAISPEEACELGDPSLFTPAQDVAYAITNIAKRRSGDKLHHRPFLPFAGTYKEQNQVYKGNKVDDISCVAVWVVCENEESVKNFVKYPDRPSTLETDRYYNNSILYAFNEMSKLCTPSKAFVKNKDKIERVNLEYPHTMVNIIPHYQHYQGDISSGMMREDMIGATGNSTFNNNFSNNSHMLPNQGVFSFDTTETPIKYGNAKNAKDECEDLSDIILHDHEDYMNDEKEDENEDREKKKTVRGADTGAQEKGNKNQKGVSSDNFNDEYINRTPEPLHGDFSSNINEGIEDIENMYLKTPPLFSAESSKINQRNLRNAKTTASINEAVQKAQFLQSLNYETPIKEMRRSGNNNNSNANTGLKSAINGSNSTDSIAASMTEAQFKEQMRMMNETPIKMDKRAVKNAKRKSIFAENLDSPTKANYAPKRTKRK